MSIRHGLLKALNDKGILLMQELMDALGEKDRKKIHDNLNAAIQDRLIDRIRDDATHLPAYQITPLGKERLAAGVGSKGGENMAKRAKAVAASTAPVESANAGDAGIIGMDMDLGPTVHAVDHARAGEEAVVMLEQIAMIADRYSTGVPQSALDGVKAMEAALGEAYARLNRWSEVAHAYNIHDPEYLSEVLEGIHCPAAPITEAPESIKGYMVIAASVDIDMPYPDVEQARKVAEEATLSDRDNFHVLALLGTTRFEMVPTVKWEGAQ